MDYVAYGIRMQKGEKMILPSIKKSVVYAELDDSHRDFWFDRKHEKFLSAIDTLYYSIKIRIDSQNDEKHYEELITALSVERERCRFEGPIGSRVAEGLIVQPGGFAGVYGFHLKKPDQFDVFIAEKTPNVKTPEIFIQLRSKMLWEIGASLAIDKSYEIIKALLDWFELTVESVSTNRTDYCYHTNYIQEIGAFLNPLRIARTSVSRYKKYVNYGTLKEENAYGDYILLGRLKSNNVMIRFYNKSKEVIEMVYKGFFLPLWELHGLINRYDYYCLYQAYLKRSWTEVDRARLQFYIEHGGDDEKKCMCLDALEQNDISKIREFAEALTPPVTQIMNVEWQVMKKFINSIKMVNFKGRTGILSSVKADLDNRPLILNYLSFENLRHIRRGSADRLSRCDLSHFWTRLRECKLVDCPTPPKSLKLVRERAKTLDEKASRRRAMSAVNSYATCRGFFEPSLETDIIELLSSVTDNDMYVYGKGKQKRSDIAQSSGISKKSPDHDTVIISKARLDILQSISSTPAYLKSFLDVPRSEIREKMPFGSIDLSASENDS